MPANTSPIYALTPNVGMVAIGTTIAEASGSSGASTGAGTDLKYVAFTAGANGSYIDRVRFYSVATAATTGVATTLRVYLSTVASPGATTAANTFLLGEVSVPAIASANTTNATNYFDVVLGFAIPTGKYILVSQALAQTTNQNWIAMGIGGDY